jgi:2-C-methyl-D-erythritol 2,4-cyclodiphosphate synthase
MNEGKRTMRIGFGCDVHQLVEGRKLFLGGVPIPFAKGLIGHSDADALLHAVCDSLLGAAGLGDIGLHFPDTDPYYKNMSSLKLLEKTGKMVYDAGYRVVNMDSVVVAQAPKLSSYRSQMESNISASLGIEPSQVSVKFKTAENLGPIGAGEGIGAMCTVLLENRSSKPKGGTTP